MLSPSVGCPHGNPHHADPTYRAPRVRAQRSPHAMINDKEDDMPECVFAQQVALLLQRLTAAGPPWGATRAGARGQSALAQAALARALTVVAELPEPLTAQEGGD